MARQRELDLTIGLIRRARSNVKTSWVEQPVSPRTHETSYVDLMAVVIGDVTIGEHINIAPGATIVEALPDVSEELAVFASEVVEVNKELAAGYLNFEQRQLEQKKNAKRVKKEIEDIRQRKGQRRELWQWLYDSLKI
ncbi:MAG: hypothetical protein H8D67_15875 [Deltaproteobacteria bacterium]|nr:hypothetical protein [Deltaproteobacteria bacterium]